LSCESGSGSCHTDIFPVENPTAPNCALDSTAKLVHCRKDADATFTNPTIDHREHRINSTQSMSLLTPSDSACQIFSFPSRDNAAKGLVCRCAALPDDASPSNVCTHMAATAALTQ